MELESHSPLERGRIAGAVDLPECGRTEVRVHAPEPSLPFMLTPAVIPERALAGAQRLHHVGVGFTPGLPGQATGQIAHGSHCPAEIEPLRLLVLTF